MCSSDLWDITAVPRDWNTHTHTHVRIGMPAPNTTDMPKRHQPLQTPPYLSHVSNLLLYVLVWGGLGVDRVPQGRQGLFEGLCFPLGLEGGGQTPCK